MMAKTTTSTIKSTERPQNKNLIPGAKDPRTITSASKKAGRARKKEAQRMMNKLMEFGDMNMKELTAYVDKHKDNIRIKDLVLLQHVEDMIKDKKVRLDWLNRHVSYAPQKQEVTGDLVTGVIKIGEDK